MTTIKAGAKAPDFTLPDDQGKKVKLSDFRGKKVVLYFYPRDNTSGCTREACDFRDHQQNFDRAGAVVIGISPDTEKSHQNFRRKYNLPFLLLCDPEKTVAEKYGVFKEKKMYGKTVLGIERSTFLIDEKGKLVSEMRKVKVTGHVDQVVARIER